MKATVSLEKKYDFKKMNQFTITDIVVFVQRDCVSIWDLGPYGCDCVSMWELRMYQDMAWISRIQDIKI